MATLAGLVLTALTPTALLAVPQQPAATAIEWSSDLAATLARATEKQQPVLVFFTASWCVPCKEMKAGACSTPEFAAAFAGHALALVDVDANKVAAKQWQVGPIPDVRFVDAAGEELGGFVGGRSVDGMIAARDAAIASGKRADELRAAVAAAPADARALLALGEHLLRRPSKRPGIDALQRAIDADAGGRDHVAARAHWQIVGAQFQALGRASAEDAVSARERLAKLDAFGSDPAAPTYANAVRAWIAWTDAMTAWSEQRKAPANRGQPLRVADDAPLRTTLAILCAAAATPDSPAADAAADGLLIDGLLHYYAGDLDTGIARLTAFTRDYPHHRWIGEGHRFLGVVKRVKEQRDAKQPAK